MPKIILLLTLLVLSLFAMPEWTNSFDEAKLKAGKEDKVIMLMLSRQGCDACWYMEKIVFVDTKVKSLIKKSFIPVYLDVNKDGVADKFKYIGTPTFYFTDKSGNIIGKRLNGAINTKDFIKALNKVILEDK